MVAAPIHEIADQFTLSGYPLHGRIARLAVPTTTRCTAPARSERSRAGVHHTTAPTMPLATTTAHGGARQTLRATKAAAASASERTDVTPLVKTGV